MHEVLIVAIVFGSITTCFLLICLVPVWIIKTLRGGSLKKVSRQKQIEEARLVQEVYKGLTCMESRIEVLETILLEKGKKYERI